MDSSHFLISLAALLLLGLALDRIASSAWTAAHKKVSLLARLSIMAAAYALVDYTNASSEPFHSFFIWLCGLAIGFRIADKIKVWQTKRADARELTETIEQALIARKIDANSEAGANAANGKDKEPLSFDVTRYETEVLCKRIDALIKSGYYVTSTTDHSANTVTLTVASSK